MEKYLLNTKNNHKVYLSIGSNIENKLDNLKTSLKYLTNDMKITLIKSSSIYNTDPLYYKKQSNFLNMVVEINTSYTLHQLLNSCKNIEYKMGRDFNAKKNHERIIDLDILTYNDFIYNDESISIPHPLIQERKFVLIPLVEITNDFIIPGINLSVENLLNNIKDNSKVCKFVS